MIKLILCDLDGTLLDDKKNISSLDKETIKNLVNAKFVVASGRPFEGVLPIIKELNLQTKDNYTICYNGAVVIENLTKNILFSKTISGLDVKNVFKLAQKYNLNFHAFRKDGLLLTNEKNPYTAVEERINHISAITSDILKLDDNDEFIKCMIVSSKENIDSLLNVKELNEFDYLNISRSSDIFLEFLNKDASKGLALEFLANYLNLESDQTMAIGDADNDKSMLEKAYIGVAMEKHFKCLDQYAKFVTKSNNESGVSFAIKHFNII